MLKQALTRNKDQLGSSPRGGTRYIALNTTIKPFDNVNVRKAIIAGFDRNALRLTRGGADRSATSPRATSRRASPASRRPAA